MDTNVDSYHYMGFQPYAIKQIATKKPGIGDYYHKAVYSDMAKTKKRESNSQEINSRFESIYKRDYINTLKDYDYNKSKENTLKPIINKYEYGYNPILTEISNDKIKRKDNNYIREKFAEIHEDPENKISTAGWDSMYRTYNAKTKEYLKSCDFTPAKGIDIYKSRYHKYHEARYKTEGFNYLGYPGDIPYEKFFRTDQPKIHSSNYELSKGTAKASEFPPGYAGFLPTNTQNFEFDRTKIPYFVNGKSNHYINYHLRIPDYAGFIPKNPKNLKGNPRPYCLSTKEETFC